MTIKKICVFAASSPGIHPSYLDAGREMANILIQQDIEMSYGAGSAGIMGAMADEMLKLNGKVTGIIPGFMQQMGWAHPDLKDIVTVDTMHERKSLMMKDVDAIIAMPGGVGTLEELLEAITLKQLGQFLKPIIILNTNCFYDPLLSHFEEMIDQHFMRPLHGKIWQVANEPEEVIGRIQDEPDWDPEAIMYAAVEANTARVRTSGL
ncbi:MAG: TIGR00730 family Rossman fold protein [Bacteroidales bacterium]|nr:TIGR00730 family Rossman fold protein [Bacteroidales bacterium]